MRSGLAIGFNVDEINKGSIVLQKISDKCVKLHENCIEAKFCIIDKESYLFMLAASRHMTRYQSPLSQETAFPTDMNTLVGTIQFIVLPQTKRRIQVIGSIEDSISIRGV